MCWVQDVTRDSSNSAHEVARLHDELASAQATLREQSEQLTALQQRSRQQEAQLQAAGRDKAAAESRAAQLQVALIDAQVH